VLVHALPGATFAACMRLFRAYPLAVTPRSADGWYRSMVLMDRAAGRAAGPPGFFVLTQARDDLFVIRSWDHGHLWDHGVLHKIAPGEPVPGSIRQVIADGMPVPHDGALLGWVADSQVTAMLAAHWGQPRDDPVPEIRVMPMAGTSELPHWPPFAAGPLDDGRLWEYVERGQIVDIVPLVTQSAGRAFWVPSPDMRSARHGCVVIRENLRASEYWLPAGVYMDHWTLREGIQPPPADRLLMLPGVVDLARTLRPLTDAADRRR
jgi:hypothetical protein